MADRAVAGQTLGFWAVVAEWAVASTEIFEISALVSDNDRDKEPSYNCCGEGTEWF